MRRTPRLRILLATALALALATTVATAATASATTPSTGPSTGAASVPAHTVVAGKVPVRTLTQAQLADETTASRTAVAQRKAVPVDSLTTPYSTVTANPAGDFTFSESVLPERIRRGNGWVSASAKLRRNADGTYSPSASLSGLTISGGGSGPLASMTDNGAGLGISWPSALPTPTVSGATATYSNVLPGVDLQVTATVTGGFSDVLVVHNAAAAANPALAALTFTTQTHGVTLHADAAGDLTATDAHRQVMFTAAAPSMWDSNTTLPTAQSSRMRADVSTTSAPGLAATQRQLGVHLAGSTLTLVPDRTMLTDPHAHFPMFIDPSYAPQHSIAGQEQDFDEVKQGSPCNGVSYFDNSSSSADNGELGVGYDGFAGGCDGIMRAFYQIGIPQVIWGSTVSLANVVASIPYAAANGSNSNAVELQWVAPISSSTDWNNQPPTGNVIATTGFTTTSNSPNMSIGLTITSTVQQAATGNWTALTVGLHDTDEASNDDIDFVRFGDNPHLNINYDHTPNVPATGDLTSTSGTTSVPCATSGSLPFMGKTASVTPPSLNAAISDPDGDAISATFSYGVAGGATTTLTSAIVSSGTTATVSLPSSFISGLSTTSVTTIAYSTTVFDGSLTSAASSTCEFNYDPLSPDPPTVSSTTYPSSGLGAAAGTVGAFTLTAATGESVADFVFRLDNVPPTGGSSCTGSFSTPATSNAATVDLSASSPGTHQLYVYACDSAGNISGLQTYQFTAAGDPSATFASLKAAFNNTAVSSTSTGSGSANADGLSDALPPAQLTAQGWTAGAAITVDGAPMTLPNYGSGAPDNVLAANQTIDVGQTGSALVFLAFSTNASVPQQPFENLPGDITEPAIPSGTGIAGAGCTIANGAPTNCSEPTGTLTYSTSSGTTNAQYSLSAPDWVTGPSSLAAISLSNEDGPNGPTGNPLRIYAFAVPLNTGAQLSSVTLPDISAAPAANVPGLHILAMGVRPVRTAGAPSGDSWTGAWAAPVETTYANGGSAWDNQTIRTVVTPSVSGNTVRVTLSDARNTIPLHIGEVTIAPRSSGAAASSAPVPLTFGGADAVTIPAGGEAISDPLPLSVAANSPQLVSYQLTDASAATIPGHSDAELGTTYVTAAGSGNHTTDTAASAFTSTGSTDYLLTNVDIATAGTPTLVVVGDNLTLGTGTTPGLGVQRLPTELASAGTGFGVVGAGIANNQVDASQSGAGGVSLMARIDRDVLSDPGVTTVVVDEGLTDVLAGTGQTALMADYGELGTQLNAWGINVIIGTLPPCVGYAACGSAIDQTRTAVNTSLGNTNSDLLQPYQTSITFDAAVGTTNSSGAQVLQSAADNGDHVNLTATGYQDLLNAQSPDDGGLVALLQGIA